MTWYCRGFGGGETRDPLIEGFRGLDPTGTELILLPADWTIITTPTKNGTGALNCPAGVTTPIMLITVTPDITSKIHCFEVWVNYNGNPAAAHYLIQFYGYPSDFWFLEVGTDRKVRVVHMHYVGAVAVYTPLTPWSEGVLGNGAWTHLAWFVDPMTLGVHHTWTTVVIDNVTQIAADLGEYPGGTFGFYLGPTSAVSVDIRFDDVCYLVTGIGEVASAPHLAAAPIAKCAAQHPNAPGTKNVWLMFPNTGEARWQDWDDATGNDGDSTYLYDQGLAGDQDSDFQSAADLGWGGSAVVLEYSAGVGPVWSIVHKTTGTGTKWGTPHTVCNLAVDVAVSDPGTNYVGTLKHLTRTSGSWALADLGTLTAGALSTAVDHDKNWRITTLLLQWAFYDTTLSLTPGPMIPQGQIF